MGTPYRECPNCGAHLDAGEPCDCAHKERDPRPAAEPEKPLQRMRLIAGATVEVFLANFKLFHVITSHI